MPVTQACAMLRTRHHPRAMQDSDNHPLIVGRYALHDEIASGGMATIHLGRLMGPVGFSRTVAVKRLHPTFAKDPEFVAMFMDEARLASRIRHPNVVSILDVAALHGELLLIMDYIAGESLARLIGSERRRGSRIPHDIVVRILSDTLAGLHAAHNAKTDRGDSLGLVHRDVSPQNVLVGEDGTSHLIDFGVAKAAGRIQTTREGQIKGKVSYMAPEQIRQGHVDKRSDVYSAGVVLWEMLVGRRAYDGSDAQVLFEVLTSKIPKPSDAAPEVPPGFDAVVMKAASPSPDARYASAMEMADALEAVLRPATPREVARWVRSAAGAALAKKARRVAIAEGAHRSPHQPRPSIPTDPDPAGTAQQAPSAHQACEGTPDRNAIATEGPVGLTPPVPGPKPQPLPVPAFRGVVDAPRRPRWSLVVVLTLGSAGLFALGFLLSPSLSVPAGAISAPSGAPGLLPSHSASSTPNAERALAPVASTPSPTADSQPRDGGHERSDGAEHDEGRTEQPSPGGSGEPSPFATSPLPRAVDRTIDDWRRKRRNDRGW